NPMIPGVKNQAAGGLRSLGVDGCRRSFNRSADEAGDQKMVCTKCGQTVDQGSVVIVRNAKKNQTPIELCPACADGFRKAFELETQDPRLGTGILVGIGAALIASLVWYTVVVGTQYEVGFVAVGVGWLVAQAVMLGAGRKRGASLQFVSVGITLLAMTIGE